MGSKLKACRGEARDSLSEPAGRAGLGSTMSSWRILVGMRSW